MTDMKVVSQDSYLDIKPLKNGWMVRWFAWNKEQYRWEEQEAYCYQDFDVLMQILKEALSE